MKLSKFPTEQLNELTFKYMIKYCAVIKTYIKQSLYKQKISHQIQNALYTSFIKEHIYEMKRT